MKKIFQTIQTLLGARTWFTAILVMAAAAGGCARAEVTPVYEELISVELTTEQEARHPGDVFIVEARIKNLSDLDLDIRQLNAASLEFWVWSEGNSARLRRMPTFSSNENMSMVGQLRKGKTLTRRFLFTTVTETEGAYCIQALFTSPVVKKKANETEGTNYIQALAAVLATEKLDSTTTVSEPMRFSVQGERRWQRGDDGLILGNEAIRVAKDYLGRPAMEEQARLIMNEAGFFDWYVTLSVAPEALAEGEPERKAYFVNPYRATVRKEAKADGDESFNS